MIKLAHPIITDDERNAVLEALDSGQLAQGPRVAAFEEEFARYVGARHAVAVSSGTAALHLALLAHIGWGERGDNELGAPQEVIVPAFSFAATANAVLLAGALPVFVDVRDDDFNIDPDDVAAAVTPRTRAVVAVHLYGQPCDLAAIAGLCEMHGLTLIEDAAQSAGASFRGRRTGSFGTAAFSFYATKNIQTGEGGMITTDDELVAERARMLRSQGELRRYVTDILGYNYRMTEVAAALGRAQLPKLDAWNQRRRHNAMRLNELLSSVSGIVLPREVLGRTHAWHQYTVRVTGGRERRDALQDALRQRGIETGVFYPAAIHEQPLYRNLGFTDVHAPVAERLAGEVLSLPVHPSLSDADVETIAAAVRASL